MISDNQITGFGDQAEELHFDAPVAIQAIAETINACVEASKKSVRRELTNAMQTDGSVIDLLNSDCINQAIEMTDLVRNTLDMEAAI